MLTKRQNLPETILVGTCNKGVRESVLKAVDKYNTERFSIC